MAAAPPCIEQLENDLLLTTSTQGGGTQRFRGAVTTLKEQIAPLWDRPYEAHPAFSRGCQSYMCQAVIMRALVSRSGKSWLERRVQIIYLRALGQRVYLQNFFFQKKKSGGSVESADKRRGSHIRGTEGSTNP